MQFEPIHDTLHTCMNDTGPGGESMFVLCLALWLIICGNVTWETAGFGVAIAAGVTWLGRRLTGASREKELKMIRKLPAAIRLGGRLFTVIVRANLKVAGMVYREEDPDSCLVTFQAPLRTTAARTVLADCITLTPGTITAGLEGDLTLTLRAVYVEQGEQRQTVAVLPLAQLPPEQKNAISHRHNALQALLEKLK